MRNFHWFSARWFPGQLLASARSPQERISFDATVELHAAAGDGSTVPRFEAEAYNGGTLRVARYPMPVVIDLQGLEFAADIKANLDHDTSQRVGHVDKTVNDGRRILLAGPISGTGPAAQEVLANHKNGYPWKLSVEALPTSSVEEIRAGQRVTVNGQTFTGPLMVARKSRLYGVAFLARGADETTKVSIAAGADDINPRSAFACVLASATQSLVEAGSDAVELQSQLIEAAGVSPGTWDQLRRGDVKAAFAEFDDARERVNAVARALQINSSDLWEARQSDANAGIQAGSPDSVSWESNMTFEEWIKAMAFEPGDLTEKQTAHLKTRYEKETKGNEPIVAAAFSLDDIRAAAEEYQANLEISFAKHEDGVKAAKLAEIKAAALKSARELKTKAIEEKWASAKFEVEAIKAASKVEVELIQAEMPAGPAIHASNKDFSNEVIEASLAIGAGLSNVENHYKEETLEAAHRGFRNVSLGQVFIMAAAQNGYVCQPGERIHNGNLKEILQHAFAPPIQASSHSTLSLSGILSNIANKEILEGFMVGDQTWREIAAVRTVTDLKAVTSYRLLDNMEYEELSPAGEIAHGKLGEDTYTRQAETFAKMFTLRRTDILNDDIGAFDTLRSRLGKGSILKLNKLFWATFLNNLAFFTLARGNYIEGADTVLDSDALKTAVTAFMKMKTPEGDFAEVSPEILLVPPELQTPADELYVSTNLNTGGSSTKNKVPNRNVHAGKYRPVTARYLSDQRLTGYSTTAWYLLGDPAMLPTVVVSFLNGQQSPTVESADADFNVLGVQFRGYHDFGVSMAEYLGGLKSKGAAG